LDQIIGFIIDGTGLDITGFVILCGVSFLGSFLTATMGIGGGVLVLATMAQILPPAVLIPIHGVVQLGSNVGRATLMRKHILTTIVPAFLIGTALGALLGAELVITLPIALLQVVLGLFILYATWAPKFKASNPGKPTFFGIGFGATLATMFVGATGPLVAPFVNAACPERQQVVATHATLMTIQHGLKIVAFGTLGFAFGPYIPLLAGLIVFGFAGTWSGKHVLLHLPEKMFRTGLKVILTLLAGRLFYSAINGYV
jgi:uncharacterized membrane protein YfcA